MRIVLHVDRLVLDGIVDRRQAVAVHQAVVAELTTLLATGSADWRPSTPRKIVVSRPLRVSRSTDPAQLGRAIARSVHTTIQPSFRGGHR